MNEALSTKDAKKLNKASMLSTSTNPKDQDRARARQTEVDYKDLVRQLKAKRRQKMKEDYVIEKEDSPYERASSGALSGKTRSSGASKTEPKTGFGRKAHRNSAAMIIRAKRKAERSGKKLSDDDAADLAHKGWASSVKYHKSSMTPEQQKRRQKLADTPYKKLSKDEQDKDKVSAKAIMSVHDKQKKKKVNEATTSRYTSIAAKANTAIKDVERKEKLKRINKTLKAMRKHRDFHPLLHNPKGGATTADLRGEEVEAKESFEIDKTAHKSAQRKAKLRNLAKGNANPNEKAAAEKKAGGPKLIGERLGGKGYKPRKDYAGRTVSGDWEDSDRGAGNKATRRAGGKVKKKSPTYQAYVLNKEEVVSEGKTFDAWKKAAAKALGKKKEERTAQKAMDAGARLRRKKQRQEYAAKVSGSEDIVPDDIRD